jgi:hypothetical protein
MPLLLLLLPCAEVQRSLAAPWTGFLGQPDLLLPVKQHIAAAQGLARAVHFCCSES